MNKTIEFSVDKADIGKRIDIFLSKNLNRITRSYIKKLIKEKKLKINNQLILTPATKVKINDKISFLINKKDESVLKPKKIKLNIVFEDSDILIINKPKGMTVHPGAGNLENTLANALAYKYKKKLSNISGTLRPGIVHRIDKDTSGLLVVAKNNFAHSELGKQFSKHTISRKYQCLVWGVIRPLNGRIETLITRNRYNRQLMQVSEHRGKKAITNYKTIKVFGSKEIPRISLVNCYLETGRTHQIRVHLKYKGTSILGDNQYGGKKLNFKKSNQKFLDTLKKIKGQALHAETLGFNHPTKNKYLSFRAEPPSDFKKMLNLLSKLSG